MAFGYWSGCLPSMATDSPHQTRLKRPPAQAGTLPGQLKYSFASGSRLVLCFRHPSSVPLLSAPTQQLPNDQLRCEAINQNYPLFQSFHFSFLKGIIPSLVPLVHCSRGSANAPHKPISGGAQEDEREGGPLHKWKPLHWASADGAKFNPFYS